MKKITYLLLTFLIANNTALAQESVNYDTSAQTSFVNAVDIGPGASPGDTSFGYNPTLTSVVTGTSVELIPNTEIWMTNNGSNSTFNTFWFSAEGVPRKSLEILTFNEIQWDGTGTAPSISNQEITFSADLSAYDIDPNYTVKLYITVFEGGFSNFRRETFDVPNTPGSTYSVVFPAANASANDRIWQYGFIIDGPMADPADTSVGSATFGQTVLSTNDLQANIFSLSPNPTNNVWNIESNSSINTIEVYDTLGKSVLSVTANSQNVSIDGSSLKTGIYLAKISSNESSKTIRLIKN